MVLDLAYNNMLQGYSEKVVQMISREFPTVDLLGYEINSDFRDVKVSFRYQKIKVNEFLSSIFSFHVC